MAVGQHAVRAGESIPVPKWTCPGESFPVENGTVIRAGKSITYNAAGASSDRGRSSAI